MEKKFARKCVRVTFLKDTKEQIAGNFKKVPWKLKNRKCRSQDAKKDFFNLVGFEPDTS